MAGSCLGELSALLRFWGPVGIEWTFAPLLSVGVVGIIL